MADENLGHLAAQKVQIYSSGDLVEISCDASRADSTLEREPKLYPRNLSQTHCCGNQRVLHFFVSPNSMRSTATATEGGGVVENSGYVFIFR